MQRLLARDERELSVDRAGDRLDYLVVSFGVLTIAAYRSFAGREPTWDLLAVVIAGGLVGWAYRAAHRALDRRSTIVVGVTIAVALGVALAIAMLIAR